MNKKADNERADKFIKIRTTEQLRKNFNQCCEANGKNMSQEIVSFMEKYIAKNMHKVKKRIDNQSVATING